MLKDWLLKVSLSFPRPTRTRKAGRIPKDSSGRKDHAVVQLFGTETLGLELSQVSRVEEIKPDDIELVGDKEYIEFRGRTLRLIRPEEYLPISRREYDRKKLYVIIPKLTGQPMGLLIGRIHDTVVLPSEFNEQDIKAHGIKGTTFWNRRIVLALDLDELLQKAAPEEYGGGSLMEANAGKEGRY